MDDDVTLDPGDSTVWAWIARMAIVLILAVLVFLSLVALEVLSDVRDELERNERIVVTWDAEVEERELGA